ncbi:MAG: alpha/beta hydrolase [Nannocystaceae bacterium]
MTTTAQTSPSRLRLPEGRELAWSEWGTPDGWPVMFFHGGADSRLEGALLHEAALHAGVRLIAPDRPGFGASDPMPDRRFVDWPDDVHTLAEHLRLSSFSVVGHSGGGPHALAVAADPRDRVRSVVVVAGAAPRPASGRGMGLPFRLNRRFAISVPWLQTKLLTSHRDDVYDDPERFLSQWGRLSAPEGRLFEEHPEVGKAVVAQMREGYRQGIAAARHEGQLYYRDWGFELEAIEVPVHLVYGSKDAQAPVRWGTYLQERIPGARLTVVEGEAHFSVLVRQAAAIVAAACP